jgi:N6-adenosine-specific RNA methylase IME4
MGSTAVIKKVPANVLAQVNRLRQVVHEADTAEKLVEACAMIDSLEDVLRRAGYEKSIEVMRPANETRFEARWRLGQMLVKMERGTGPGRGKKMSRAGTSFRDWLKEVGLDKNRAVEMQRIGAIPTLAKLHKAFEEATSNDVLNTVASMMDYARPFWKMQARARKHRAIADAASPSYFDDIGVFPLIYADPPWRFETWSESGGGRSPDQHYPTLSDDEILDFAIEGRPIAEIAAADSILFLWCTSSNLPLALQVMERWGFTFKSSAVWVKEGASGRLQVGMGQIFRNAHELLLYGDRGDVAGPVEIPFSVFKQPRGKHSAKPAEIRAALERMYPDFADNRLELFARGSIPGWVTYGYESTKENHDERTVAGRAP